MLSDRWLQRWLPTVLERAGTGPVLEIGCGRGSDTATLVVAGARVIAFDLSPSNVAAAQARAPQATVSCQDARSPWPTADQPYGVIVASLSLHYFAWHDTVTLVSRIHAALRPGGLLLCRLNSTRDHHHGARGHPAIEPNYYDVRGEPKRFFDRAALTQLFASGWRTLSIQETKSYKYVRPKVLWELALERAA
jgi:trans-aconitate methyltransferase